MPFKGLYASSALPAPFMLFSMVQLLTVLHALAAVFSKSGGEPFTASV